MQPVAENTLEAWQAELAGKSAEHVLAWAAAQFRGKIRFATSLGLEDQVLTDMIARAGLPIALFTLDTGRLFQETYDLIDRTRERYGIDIEICFPEADAVRAMVHEHGVNLFRKSVDLRKRCCGVRKIEPLRRAIAGQDAWIVGLRREQSVTRSEMRVVEWDGGNGLVKVSPLIDWTEPRVRDYVKNNKVPYNPLHDQNFPSIGCACCTRAVADGEDIRAGRWWWENPEQKECGLHGRPGFGAKES
jgi:phosphoadenosine phosphosulfate reductase